MPRVNGSVNNAPPPVQPRKLQAGDVFTVDGDTKEYVCEFCGHTSTIGMLHSALQGWYIWYSVAPTEEENKQSSSILDPLTDSMHHPEEGTWKLVGQCKLVKFWQRLEGGGRICLT